MDKCGGVIDAAKETVVLALKFADKTVLDSPDLAARVLRSSQVKKAIEAALLSEGKRLLQKQQQGSAATNEDGAKLLNKIGKSASSAGQAVAKKEITSSREFKEVTQSLKELECAFRGSPIGVFVDRNEGWLIVVATGLALGGATAMYVSKTGDWPAGQMARLLGTLVRFKVLGNVEVGLENVKFKPSTQMINGRMFASAKWKAVSAKVSFQVSVNDNKLASTNAQGEIVVKAGAGFTLSGKGGVGYSVSPDAQPGSQPVTYNLSLGIAYGANLGGSSLNVRLLGYASQESLQRKQGGTLGASFKFVESKTTSVAVDFNASLSRLQTLSPTGPAQPQVDGSVNLGLTFKFQ
ncbi:MAG: hypothetical protein ABGZ53_04020 [Fuerstiella sp.]